MRKLQYLFMTLSVLFMAVPAFAQTGGDGGMAVGLSSIAAGLGMGLAAGLCGLGQGRATASFMESLSLFTLVIIFTRVHYQQ
jgi:F-type H+-transporting ATPase subunit c